MATEVTAGMDMVMVEAVSQWEQLQACFSAWQSEVTDRDTMAAMAALWS